MKKELAFILSILFLVSLTSIVLAADSTAPVLGIYLSQDDNGQHNEISYKPTIYANLWNQDVQTSVTQCQIDWNDGSGWETISVGSEGVWYSIGHTYSSLGLQRVNYRCQNSAGIWTAGNTQEANYDTITIQALAPSTAIYLGEESGTHNDESHNYTIYASLWNNDAVYGMSECQINWGDGAGFEPINIGNEGVFYYEEYTYSTEGLKTVSYKCQNSAGTWSTNNLKHQSFDEITLSDCDTCDCDNDYSETSCQGNLFVNTTFNWTCTGGCALSSFETLIQDCSNDTVDYGSYYCVDDNRTRDVTTYNGVCDDNAGCSTESTISQDVEVCEYGCAGGICQDESTCTDGETRNVLDDYSCYGGNAWSNQTYELCTLNTWTDVYNFSLFENCGSETELLGGSCLDNATLEQNWSSPSCSSGACGVTYSTNLTDCSGEDAIVDYYCSGYDLYENWSSPGCFGESCSLTYYSNLNRINSSICGWVNESYNGSSPVISIINPVNASTYNYTNFSVFAISDLYINQWFYSINGATNVEVFGQNGFNISFYGTFIEGENTLRIWGINETMGLGYIEFLINLSGSDDPINNTNDTDGYCTSCHRDSSDDDNEDVITDFFRTSRRNETEPRVYGNITLGNRDSNADLSWTRWVLIILFIIMVLLLVAWIIRVV